MATKTRSLYKMTIDGVRIVLGPDDAVGFRALNRYANDQHYEVYSKNEHTGEEKRITYCTGQTKTVNFCAAIREEILRQIPRSNHTPGYDE